VSRISLGPEVELAVEVIDDPLDDRPCLDLRICRRAPGDSSRAIPTQAGFRFPLHLAGLVAETIRRAGVSGAVSHARRSRDCE
jgi:hypothetical protein